MGGSKDASVHGQALATVFDVEFIPGLKENMPWSREERTYTVKKKPANVMKKRPASAVKKRPASVSKNGLAVRKKPASVALCGPVKKKPAAKQ